jgi:hypothetical protein
VKVPNQLRERIRYLDYSIPTEEVYVQWVRAFIRFHVLHHRANLGDAERKAFLSWHDNARCAAASAHMQASHWQETE